MISLQPGCYLCGRRNPADARFCGRCGTSLEVARCRSCQSLLPRAARFCGMCGVRVQDDVEVSALVVPEEQLRTVTVVFALLADVAPLVEENDPEEVKELLDEVFGLLSQEVTRHGGSIDKIMADSLLALFGVPTAHEGDPVRAVKAALAMNRALEGFNRRLFEKRGLRLSFKVGINTGKVIVGYVGGQFKRDLTVMGDTVNTASRLEHAAPPGGILIAESTRRALGERFDVRAWEPLTVKNKREPIKVYQVLGETPDPNLAFSSRPIPMVGRTRELDLLVGLWREVENQRVVRWVTLYGDIGMGKGRLLTEFIQVTRRGAPPPLVFTVRDRPGHPDEPTDVLRMLVREIAGVTPWDDAAAEWSKIQDLARRSVRGREGNAQEAAETFARMARVPVPGRDPGESPGRRRYFLPFRRLLEELAANQPVLIAVSALHEADNLALDFLEEVATQLPDLPVMILGMARPTLLTRRPEWGQGSPRHHPVHMSPLSAREARLLLTHVFGSDAVLTPDWIESVNQFAGGNPLHLIEIARSALEARSRPDVVEPAALVVPDSMESVIQARLDRLPFEDGLTLRAAAVVGHVFWRGAVSAALGSDRGTSLERLVERGFVLRQPQSGLTGEEEYTFAMKAAAQVAYENLLSDVRKRYHNAAAEWLQGRLRRDPGPYRVNLAHHLERGGNPQRAAEVYREAAEVSLRAFEYDESLQLVGHALSCLLAGAEPSPAEEARLCRLRGMAHAGKGEVEAARLDLERVIELCQSLADTSHRIEAALQLAEIALQSGDVAETTRWLGQAQPVSEEVGRPHLEAKAACLEAQMALVTGQMEQVLPRLERAEGIWRRLGDKKGLAAVLETRGHYHHRSSDFVLARRSVREAVELLEFLGDLPGLADGLINLGTLCENLGDLSDARQHYARASALVRRLGDRWSMAAVLGHQGSILLKSGYWGRARAAVEQGRELSRELGNPWSQIFCEGALGLIWLRVGDWQEAMRLLAGCVEQLHQMGDRMLEGQLRTLLGESLLRQSHLAQAQVEYEIALDHGARHNNPELEALALIGLSEVASAREDAAAAASLIEELEWNEAVGRSPLLQAQAALSAGALALLEGNAARALARLAEAERVARDHDFWPQVWEARAGMVRARGLSTGWLPTAQGQEAIRQAQEALRELTSRIESPELIQRLKQTPTYLGFHEAARAIRAGGG